MMRSKKVMILGLGLTGLMLVGIFGTGRARAETSMPQSSIIDKLVARFNLNKDEVATVFDEVHQERQQQRQAYLAARLEEAVNDGVITAEQKQAWLNKDKEWQEKQRQMREERQKWMSESGIDFSKLVDYGVGFGGHFGRGHHWGGF